jgi:hypothetical protein
VCGVRFELIKAESLYGRTASDILHDGLYILFQGVLCLEDVRLHGSRINVISYVPLRIM